MEHHLDPGLLLEQLRTEYANIIALARVKSDISLGHAACPTSLVSTSASTFVYLGTHRHTGQGSHLRRLSTTSLA